MKAFFMALAVLTTFGIMLVACLPDQTDGSATGTTTTTADGGSAAAQACNDTATAFANAEVRCGEGDFATLKASVITQLAGGDCNTVTIRDQTALYNSCIPSLATIDCTDLINQQFSPDCAEQIIR